MLRFDSSEGMVDLALEERPVLLFCFPGIGIDPWPEPFSADTIVEEVELRRECVEMLLGVREILLQLAGESVSVYGLSSLPVADLAALAERESLGFALLADPKLQLAKRLGLPRTYGPDGSARYQYMALLFCGAGRGQWSLMPEGPTRLLAAQALAKFVLDRACTEEARGASRPVGREP